MSDKSVKPPAFTSILDSALNRINNKLGVKIDDHCSKQDDEAFTHKQVINIYIVYRINLWSYIQGGNFKIGKYLSGVVKLTKLPISVNVLSLDMVLDVM